MPSSLKAPASAPLLTHVADLTVQVAAPIALGETTAGLRRMVPITGGRLEGPGIDGAGIAGTVLPAGADYQLIREDGFTTLDARYMIQLDDGAMLYVVNQGVRFGPPEVMAKITAGRPVDPALVYFRTAPRFEIAHPAYQRLTLSLFLGVGIRHPDRVVLQIFEVG